MARKAPVRFVASTSFQASFFMRKARPSLVTAALLTRMSIFPALAKACSMESAEARSSSTQEELEISALACSSLAASRAASTTRQPAPASARAQAKPIPRLAPVTKAVLFVILSTIHGLRRFARIRARARESEGTEENLVRSRSAFGDYGI